MIDRPVRDLPVVTLAEVGSLERGLRELRARCATAGLLGELRRRAYAEPPGARRRRKQRLARIRARQRERRAARAERD